MARLNYAVFLLMYKKLAHYLAYLKLDDNHEQRVFSGTGSIEGNNEIVSAPFDGSVMEVGFGSPEDVSSGWYVDRNQGMYLLQLARYVLRNTGIDDMKAKL